VLDLAALEEKLYQPVLLSKNSGTDNLVHRVCLTLIQKVSLDQLKADLGVANGILVKIEACTEKTPLHKTVWDQVRTFHSAFKDGECGMVGS
jgi:hypothetical protein